MNTPTMYLFDLGNVLIRFRPQTFWEVLGIGDDPARRRYSPGVRDVTVKFERGEVSIDEYFQQLKGVFSGKFTRKQLEEAAGSVLTDPIEGMEAVVIEAGRKGRTALVSNTNAFHFPYCVRVVPALNLLPDHFLSFQIGAMKPDPRFYEHVIRETGVAPADMLFIDDVEENIRGAERAGLRGHLFTGADELRAVLAKV